MANSIQPLTVDCSRSAVQDNYARSRQEIRQYLALGQRFRSERQCRTSTCWLQWAATGARIVVSH